METLTPSTKPTPGQIEKLCDKLRSAVRKSNISRQVLGDALAYPGTELEDAILMDFIQFSRRASGIFTPQKAQDTGLVPKGWKVISDDLEPEINLSKLDYNHCPVQDGEGSISGDTMLKRAKEVNALGSLGFAKLLLDAQKQGKDIIPPELRGKYIICSRTILLDGLGGLRVACLRWNGEQWVLSFRWLDISFDRNGRLPRSRE